MILLSMKRNNISEVLIVRLWPIFTAVGQWDHERKVFMPYSYEEFTVDRLDSMVKYLKKHSANG